MVTPPPPHPSPIRMRVDTKEVSPDGKTRVHFFADMEPADAEKFTEGSWTTFAQIEENTEPT